MADQQKESELAARAVREHHAIQDLVKSMERFTTGAAEGTEADIREMRAELSGLHTHFERHFELEEEGGLFDDLAAKLPFADAMVTQLRQEHPVLLENVARLLRRLEDGGADEFPKVCEDLGRLVATYADHETRETDLLQQAYFQEYGRTAD